jgi:hypothetical protein
MIEYKGFTREDPLRVDVLVQRCILLEAKAVEKVLPIHKAQLLSYMKLLNVPVGLLINFHEMKVTDGIYRLVLPGANRRTQLIKQERTELTFLCFLCVLLFNLRDLAPRDSRLRLRRRPR